MAPRIRESATGDLLPKHRISFIYINDGVPRHTVEIRVEMNVFSELCQTPHMFVDT
jgi:hypothetical protein